eukprot:1144641-Pelagomonas_calceolata.AAC.8
MQKLCDGGETWVQKSWRDWWLERFQYWGYPMSEKRMLEHGVLLKNRERGGWHLRLTMKTGENVGYDHA